VRLTRVAAPCFHGTSAAVWARTRKALSARDAERALRAAAGVAVEEGEAVSPVSAAGSPLVHCLPPLPHGEGSGCGVPRTPSPRGPPSRRSGSRP